MSVLISLILCCGSISFTISTTSIFKGFRNWISKFHPKLEELIHCPWCLNHYIAALFLIPCLDFHLYDIIVNWFAIVGGGGIVHYMLLRAYEPVAKANARRELEKTREKYKSKFDEEATREWD